MSLTLDGTETLADPHDAWQILCLDHAVERTPAKRDAIMADIDAIQDEITRRTHGVQ